MIELGCIVKVPAMLAVTPDVLANPSVILCPVLPSALVANIKVLPTGTLISSPE